jgi:hypothetical protein
MFTLFSIVSGDCETFECDVKTLKTANTQISGSRQSSVPR